MQGEKLFALVLVAAILGFALWGGYRAYRKHEVNQEFGYSGGSLNWDSLGGQEISAKARLFGIGTALVVFVVGYLMLKFFFPVTTAASGNRTDARKADQNPNDQTT